MFEFMTMMAVGFLAGCVFTAWRAGRAVGSVVVARVSEKTEAEDDGKRDVQFDL